MPKDDPARAGHGRSGHGRSGCGVQACRLRLRAADRTLTAEETAAVRKRIVKRAAKVLGAELRA